MFVLRKGYIWLSRRYGSHSCKHRIGNVHAGHCQLHQRFDREDSLDFRVNDNLILKSYKWTIHHSFSNLIISLKKKLLPGRSTKNGPKKASSSTPWDAYWLLLVCSYRSQYVAQMHQPPLKFTSPSVFNLFLTRHFNLKSNFVLQFFFFHYLSFFSTFVSFSNTILPTSLLIHHTNLLLC